MTDKERKRKSRERAKKSLSTKESALVHTFNRIIMEVDKGNADIVKLLTDGLTNEQYENLIKHLKADSLGQYGKFYEIEKLNAYDYDISQIGR